MSVQLRNNDIEQAKPIYRTAMIPAAPLVTSKRILVVSYWRSGSTFLGALIRSAPGVFYSYEPLQYFNVYARIECSEQIESSIKLINALFQCKFPSDYFTYIASRKWGKPESFFMSANTQAQKLCTKNSSLCNDPTLYSSLCHEFPVHLMKTVRLPLTAVRRLIDESVHNQFKIVYLVRDPHGIMASRFNRDWCVHPSCTLASELCQQMNADLEAFQELNELYPNTFYKIRFEDFTANVEAETEKLFQFLGKFIPFIQLLSSP
jgi:Sulfotransferase family